MAYADKITNMRRLAIIMKDHNIVWEGVNIEDEVLLKKVSIYGNEIKLIDEDELDKWIEEENFRRSSNDEALLEVKYLDPYSEDYWEPRKNKLHKR